MFSCGDMTIVRCPKTTLKLGPNYDEQNKSDNWSKTKGAPLKKKKEARNVLKKQTLA